MTPPFQAWLAALAADLPDGPLGDEEAWLATAAGWRRIPGSGVDWRDAWRIAYRVVATETASDEAVARDASRSVLAWLAALGGPE